MKKKYITGLLMAALSAMLFTGCGFSIGKEIPLKDLIKCVVKPLASAMGI